MVYNINVDFTSTLYGGIAQLGERYAGSVEVVGSSPSISIYINTKQARSIITKNTSSLFLFLDFYIITNNLISFLNKCFDVVISVMGIC